MQHWSKRTAVVVLVAYVLFVSILTLRPAPGAVSQQFWTCVLCGERGTADLILNVILFAPFGAALVRLGMRPLLACGIALLFSGFLETAQSLIPGRFPTWRDVVLNASGAWLGAIVTRDLFRWLASRFAPLFFLAAVAAVPGTVLLTGWLHQPAVKRSTWFGQPSPRLPHLAPWEGRLDSALVGTSSIPNGPLRNAQAVQNAIASREPVLLSGVAAPAPARLAGLLAIADDEFEEMLLVGQEGTDLIVRERRRASQYRLFEPESRFPGLLSVAPAGTPFRLVVELDRTNACATINGQRTCSPPFAASSAWTFLIWRRGFSARTQLVLGAMTMFVLCFPVGLLGIAATRDAPVRGALTLFVGAAALVVACAVTAMAFPTPLECAAALLGIAAGGASRRSMSIA